MITKYTNNDYPSLNIQECPQGSPSFISQQCTATNDRPFNGILHTWREFTGNGINVIHVDSIVLCKLIL